ncbi:hypothetical protein [Streptomyces justiciae]|uniref:hypothetical protein n=1 Tax=Streptomyces justiciae TaxID=2780140 RepID=UPI00188305BE|nr:hypothetical protein [Streptomyces justiciae]MBE8475991.1 hypothetical protein [Streptomyces justiciae]MCW8382671.1 hypothetical protein [Streptomyces justiciae]
MILPYLETTEPGFADSAADTFVIHEHGVGLRILCGPCPRCSAPIDIPLFQETVKGTRSHPSTATSGIETVMCTCQEPHEGRPEGRVGCGAYWNFLL